jgi:hypothetical protein
MVIILPIMWEPANKRDDIIPLSKWIYNDGLEWLFD